MKPLNPNAIRIIALLFLGIIFFMLSIFLVKSCNKEAAIKVNPKAKLVSPPTNYVDKGGTTHTEAVVIEAGNIEEINLFYQQIIDSLVKVIQSKPKASEVQSANFIGTQSSATFKPKIDTIYIDSNKNKVPSYVINFKDKWLKLRGYVNIDSTWKYTVTDSIALVSYYKQKNIFSKKELLIDGFSFNPNTTIKGLTAIKLQTVQPKKWGIGIQVGYGFSNYQATPYIGIGIQRNFIRF